MSIQQYTFDHQQKPLNTKPDKFFDKALTSNTQTSGKYNQPPAHFKISRHCQTIQCLFFEIYCRRLLLACGFCLILALSFSSLTAQASETKSNTETETKADIVIENTVQLVVDKNAEQEKSCPEQLVEFWSNLSTDHRHRIDVPAFLLHTNCMESKRSTEFHVVMQERLDNPSNPKLTEQLERLFNAQL